MITYLLHFIANDFLFYLFQMTLLSFGLFGFIKDYLMCRNNNLSSVKFKIIRGPSSLSYFSKVSGVIFGYIVVTIVNLPGYWSNNSIYYLFTDFIAVFYLCFMNFWFTNLLVKFSLQVPVFRNH